MNELAKKENILALEALLGLTQADAETTLAASILLTVAEDETSRNIGSSLRDMLCRTVETVKFDLSPGEDPTLEIVIGNAAERTNRAIFAYVQSGSFFISNAHDTLATSGMQIPGVYALLGACYLAGFAIRALLPNEVNVPISTSLSINFRSLFGDLEHHFDSEVDIGTVYLAGAGAVGNGFIRALATMPNLTGTLIAADKDTISDGNLNRCVWFEQEDVGQSKASVIVEKARSRFKKLQLQHRTSMLGDVPEKTEGPWLKRLVVAVDSKRARRSLQSEIPGEVFDASTTGIEEIVFHHHKQPTDNACLSCIYHADAAEEQHAQHVARALGVSRADLTKTHIDAETESKIKQKYPDLVERQLQGIAFDTFFKELCGAGELSIDGGEQVVAPLSFVSVMAGTYLAIEFIRRITTGESGSNFWRLSPWSAPILQTRRTLPRYRDCEHCGNEVILQFSGMAWADDGSNAPTQKAAEQEAST